MTSEFTKLTSNNGPITNESILAYPSVPITEGLYNSDKRELTPQFSSTSGEEVIQKGNSWIVLGRDRPHRPESGYGGRGDTGAAAIDICVGRMGFRPSPLVVVGNNFGSSKLPSQVGDAARIYISEKADIDDYFGLPNGSQLDSERSKSMAAIAIKADDIRVIARRSIKMVTHRTPEAKNSKNQDINRQFGVEIIAGGIEGTDSEGIPYVQPMVKGLHVQDALKEITESLLDINSLMTDFVLLCMSALATQIGSYDFVFVPLPFGPPLPVPVVKDPNTINNGIYTNQRTIMDVLQELLNQRLLTIPQIEWNYLNEGAKKWVCSRHNYVN